MAHHTYSMPPTQTRVLGSIRNVKTHEELRPMTYADWVTYTEPETACLIYVVCPEHNIVGRNYFSFYEDDEQYYLHINESST